MLMAWCSMRLPICLCRDMLAHLIPEATEAASMAPSTTYGGSCLSTPLLDAAGRPQALPPMAQQAQQAQRAQRAGTAPGIVFKAASVIREELIACESPQG